MTLQSIPFKKMDGSDATLSDYTGKLRESKISVLTVCNYRNKGYK